MGCSIRSASGRMLKPLRMPRQMSEPKTKGAVVRDQSHQGSGGYAADTTGEERSHQWAVEADNDPALKEAVGSSRGMLSCTNTVCILLPNRSSVYWGRPHLASKQEVSSRLLLFVQMAEGERKGAAVQDRVAKEDPDYKPE